MDHIPDIKADREVDATGKMLLPAWCDSHTHLVYAGNREKEFVDRIPRTLYNLTNSGRKAIQGYRENLRLVIDQLLV